MWNGFRCVRKSRLGLGTPREAMRLVGNPLQPRLVSIKSGQDHTAPWRS